MDFSRKNKMLYLLNRKRYRNDILQGVSWFLVDRGSVFIFNRYRIIFSKFGNLGMCILDKATMCILVKVAMCILAMIGL